VASIATAPAPAPALATKPSDRLRAAAGLPRRGAPDEAGQAWAGGPGVARGEDGGDSLEPALRRLEELHLGQALELEDLAAQQLAAAEAAPEGVRGAGGPPAAAVAAGSAVAAGAGAAASGAGEGRVALQCAAPGQQEQQRQEAEEGEKEQEEGQEEEGEGPEQRTKGSSVAAAAAAVAGPYRETSQEGPPAARDAAGSGAAAAAAWRALGRAPATLPHQRSWSNPGGAVPMAPREWGCPKGTAFAPCMFGRAQNHGKLPACLGLNETTANCL
jgi:hypothetical protein